MKDLNFDDRGNLYPYEKNSITLNEFKLFFVDNFSVNSSRVAIFENYSKYLKDFKQDITPNFTHWIDGSFVSNKVNPKDIDFVNLIEYDVYESNEKQIESEFRLRASKELYLGIDAYTVKYYPLNHKRHNITSFDLVYWRNWFTETKKNRAKKKFKKGFVEIQFGNKIIH